MFKGSYLERVSTHVKGLFNDPRFKDLYFHNITHTEFVITSIQHLVLYYNLTPEEIENVLIAGWFHDIGYIHCYENHELESNKMAVSFLNSINFPQSRTKTVSNCIEATKLPQSPTSLVAQILCDADLSHLGHQDYNFFQSKLKLEWSKHLNKQYSDLEWNKINVLFLSKHRYFTTIARKKYSSQKLKNIQEIINQLAFHID